MTETGIPVSGSVSSHLLTAMSVEFAPQGKAGGCTFWSSFVENRDLVVAAARERFGARVTVAERWFDHLGGYLVTVA